MIALAPVGCGCDAALRSVGSAVTGNDLQFVLVDRTLPALPVGLAEPATVRLIEPTGRLAAAYQAEQHATRSPGGPVLVLVRADGQVTRVLREPVAPPTFKTELDNLRLPLGTASPSG